MRIAHRGAGLILPMGSDSAAIRAAVTRLLDEPSFRANADALGQRIRAGHDDRAIVRVIAELSSDALGNGRAEVA
jgi:UDP:flavonoid glycosyltransferase YjiC (YdhE family)